MRPMTRYELIALARPMDTSGRTEEELDRMLDLLVRALPHADIIKSYSTTSLT